jgi:NADH:ubiquinone oxidoreductase subunit K
MNNINLTYIFFLNLLIFFIGILGLTLIRKNILIIIMSIEILFFSVNLMFINFSIILDDIYGQIFSLFILTAAAAESAIGLAILVIYFRLRGIILIDSIALLKG